MSLNQTTADDAPQPPEPSQSLAVATSESARQKRKIAALEEKLQTLESGQAFKRRYVRHLHSVLFIQYNFRETNYYMAKGRAIRRIVSLFDNIEDLISENDRRCEVDNGDENTTAE
jgi:hypothetical protein